MDPMSSKNLNNPKEKELDDLVEFSMELENPLNTKLSDFVECPFNKSHIMRFSRFHKHFLKCQKQHPDDTRRPCPYNFSEMIEADKLSTHMLDCPYKLFYGSMKKDVDWGVPKIKTPYHIQFGKHRITRILIFLSYSRVLTRKHYLFCSGDDDYNSQCRFDFEGDPDDIDSVSVVGETCTRSNFDAFSGSSSSSGHSSNTMPSEQDVPRGKGRAQIFLEFTAPVRARQMCPVVVNAEEDEEPCFFSWICDKNIKGVKHNMIGSIAPDPGPSTESKPSSVPKSKLLTDLEAGLKAFKLSDEFSKKRGRGRGKPLFPYR
jgi:hypothetical protein